MWSCELPAAASAAAAFDAGRRAAYVACLDGSIICFQLPADAAADAVVPGRYSGKDSSSVPPAKRQKGSAMLSDGSGGGHGLESVCRFVWGHAAGAPVFGRPAVDAASGRVCYGLVSGQVEALSASGACLAC